MIFDGRNLHLTYAVFIFTDFQQNLFIYNRQIQHRQQKNLPVGGFWGSACRLSGKGAFLLQKSKLKNKFSIWSLLFLPIKYWAKLPAATEQNSFLTLKSALE